MAAPAAAIAWLAAAAAAAAGTILAHHHHRRQILGLESEFYRQGNMDIYEDPANWPAFDPQTGTGGVGSRVPLGGNNVSTVWLSRGYPDKAPPLASMFAPPPPPVPGGVPAPLVPPAAATERRRFRLRTEPWDNANPVLQRHTNTLRREATDGFLQGLRFVRLLSVSEKTMAALFEVESGGSAYEFVLKMAVSQQPNLRWERRVLKVRGRCALVLSPGRRAWSRVCKVADERSTT